MIGTQSRTPAPSFLANSGHEVQIEQLQSGGVLVRATYPDQRRRKDIHILQFTWLGFIIVLTSMSLLLADHQFPWLAAAGPGFIGLVVLPCVTRRFVLITRSYVFDANDQGLSLEVYQGRRQTNQSVQRVQIADITLGFSFNAGPGSLFKCWMVITPALGPELRCLYDLGGDHLATVANALRAAPRLPKRAWP